MKAGSVYDYATLQVIIGLGNPGSKFRNTRHNAGQDWLLELARSHHIAMIPRKRFFGLYGQGVIQGKKIHLLIPTTFMNLSGLAVQALCAYYQLSNTSLLVVHDELDLPPGKARFKLGGGHGGHNGLRDIINHRGGDRHFYRLRLGIGHPGNGNMVESYVLKKAPEYEYNLIRQAMPIACQALDYALASNWQQAMNQLHRKQ